jgi:hypothetical protein
MNRKKFRATEEQTMEPVGSQQHKKFIEGLVNNPVPPYNGSSPTREDLYEQLARDAEFTPSITTSGCVSYTVPPTKNRHPDSQRFHDLLKQIGDLHDQKQCDYGLSEQPFYNLECAHEWGLPSWMGIMIRISDKVRRLRAYVRNGKLLNESMEDSLMDIAVYALAAIVVNEKDKRKQNNACPSQKPGADFLHETSRDS